MVSVTINGKQLHASPEKTILQVCREYKVDDIPTLCNDDKLPAFGSCFLCVVEVEGQSRLFPSCSTKIAEGMKIQTRSERVQRARKTCLELLLSDHYADCFGPCRLGCPADVDIQGYMSLVNLGKHKEAIALIKEKNPLPSVCGRVCTRKCELSCRRSIVDAPVGIDFLKRYAADQDMLGEMWKPSVKETNGKRVAIVGGGPAGLTCAYYLVVEGYQPTIFESLRELGGMLRYGIPEYRLPKNVLDKEIDWILNLGVDVRMNETLGRDFSIDDLFSRGYKSVFVALGAQVGKSMQVQNEEAAGVLSGVEFLRNVQLRTNPQIYGRVVVVGGGNTAIDAARTSLRLGAKEVILLYRRTRNEIPANKMEVDAAEQEGVRMEFLAAPIRVNVEQDRLVDIECIRMELGEPDASGRRRPVEVKGSEFTLSCDWVISAIGQETELGGVREDPSIKVTKWKTITANDSTFETDRPGVFAGGDVVTGPADAIDAIAAGRKAAHAIDRFIKDGIVEPLNRRFESRRDNFHKITAADLPQIQKSERQDMREMAPTERILGFHEVELGYDADEAASESMRCAECGCDVGLSCQLQDYCTEYGVDQKRFAGAFNRYVVDLRHPYIKIDSNKCIRCGRCVNTCAEILNISALGFVNRGFRTIVKPAMEKALAETNCVACGNCIDVCPTGALVERMPFRKSGPWRMEPSYSICNYCSVGCNVTVQVKTSDLFFVVGAPPDAGPNNGELCFKGRFGHEHYLDGSRKTQPMIRKEGQLVPSTWEEAFAEIQNGLTRVLADHSPDRIMVSASPKFTNEELYLAGRFARAGLKTNNLDSFHRLVNGADDHALDEMFGGTYSTVGMDEIENADVYLIVGGNPTVDTPVLGWKMKRRMRKGATAIVINSGKIDLAAYATVWADARRGTITTLLDGLMAELFRRGSFDKEFVERRTTGFHRAFDRIGKLDLEEVSSMTGVATAKIRNMADLLADPTKQIVALFNAESRIDRSPNDLKALGSLLMMLGKIGVKGSGLALVSNQCNSTGMQIAGFDNTLLPGGARISDTTAVSALGDLWNTSLTGIIDHAGTNLRRQIREDKIRAAFVFGENPAVSDEFHSFINNLEFLVVADLFLTETARSANVFLPLSSHLESEGHFTNWSRIVQPLKPIGEPLNGMTNAGIFARLALVAGHSMDYPSTGDVTGELATIIRQTGVLEKLDGKFRTQDGKSHFTLYSNQVATTSPTVPALLSIDARIEERSKAIVG